MHLHKKLCHRLSEDFLPLLRYIVQMHHLFLNHNNRSLHKVNIHHLTIFTLKTRNKRWTSYPVSCLKLCYLISCFYNLTAKFMSYNNWRNMSSVLIYSWYIRTAYLLLLLLNLLVHTFLPLSFLPLQFEICCVFMF